MINNFDVQAIILILGGISGIGIYFLNKIRIRSKSEWRWRFAMGGLLALYGAIGLWLATAHMNASYNKLMAKYPPPASLPTGSSTTNSSTATPDQSD